MPKIKPLIEIDVGENTKKIFSANWRLIFQLILFQFGITLLFAPIIFYYLASISFQTPIAENNIIIPNCSVENPINSTLEQIRVIIENVSQSHTFIQGIFDCTNFAIADVQELKKINVSAYCVYGYYFGNGNVGLHTWIEINLSGTIYPIETTSGFFINPQDYNISYKKMGKGVCF
jgi:hypothetical protein